MARMVKSDVSGALGPAGGPRDWCWACRALRRALWLRSGLLRLARHALRLLFGWFQPAETPVEEQVVSDLQPPAENQRRCERQVLHEVAGERRRGCPGDISSQ